MVFATYRKIRPRCRILYIRHCLQKSKLFRAPEKAAREVYGFRIVKGDAISGLQSYTDYKSSLAFNRLKYQHYAYFDIASYFNHVYHHDLVKWFEQASASEADVGLLGAFLREIAAGRSIDCLPQGVYPSKMNR